MGHVTGYEFLGDYENGEDVFVVFLANPGERIILTLDINFPYPGSDNEISPIKYVFSDFIVPFTQKKLNTFKKYIYMCWMCVCNANKLIID